MDGPFMCFDPYSDTGYHLAGNVVHAIHASNIGKEPKIPAVYKNYLNKGLIEKPKYTNIHRFIESSKRFFPDIEKSKYIGSMYTIRTVLPNKDETDDFEFNQDFESEENLRSPGWIRYQKRIK